MILDPPPTTLPRRRAPRPGLTVRTDNGVPGIARVVLEGEIDAATVPDVRAALAAHRHDRQVTVDLRQVTFCDVAGLRALLEADAALRTGQGTLVLTGPCPSVQALLDLLGPETTLAITAAPSD